MNDKRTALQPPRPSLTWPLMNNNIVRDDLDALIEFLRQDNPILTQSTTVRAFSSIVPSRASTAGSRKRSSRRAGVAMGHMPLRGSGTASSSRSTM